jgi:hypothetical protein
MRWIYVAILVLLMGCGGSLSEEQRKQMREAREQQTIRKVTEAELTQEAFDRGKEIIDLIEKNPNQSDSIAQNHHVIIRWIDPSSPDATELERQVIDAYLNSAIMGNAVSDNVQKLGTDSLLYSKPVVTELPDGSVQVKGLWNVKMSKKYLVLGMDKK